VEAWPNARRGLEYQGLRADDGVAVARGTESDSSGIMVSTSRRGTAVKRINLRREDGVAMTEFALIVPVFLLIVAGLLAFGRVFFYWIEANHMASETARWAVVDRNPYGPGSTLQQHAAQTSTVEFASDVKVCIDFPGKSDTTADLGDPVRVRIQKPFSFVPILNMGTITVRGTSTMRIERLADNGDPLNYGSGDNIGACT
jgi:TadE-like protein